jgi:hypothetical protein
MPLQANISCVAVERRARKKPEPSVDGPGLHQATWLWQRNPPRLPWGEYIPTRTHASAAQLPRTSSASSPNLHGWSE